MQFLIVRLLIMFLLIPMAVIAEKNKNYQPSDISTVSPVPYDYKKNRVYESGIEIRTLYVIMRDSVRLAVDLYLPKGLKKGTKLPAILHQTRYWRSPDLRFPFSLFSNGLIGRTGDMIKELVANGYAIVNVDARGSGASFGSRKYPWSDNETKDGAEIVDWIISQEWSNQNVGTMGVSYSGTTAEFLVMNQHPNVKAALLMYSLFDVYEDIAYPGGIYHQHFVDNWGKFNSKLDRNKVPRGGFIVKLLVKGVTRVKTNHKVRTFQEAKRSHQDNVNVDETSKGVIFRDDQPKNDQVVSGDVFSPFSYLDDLNASGTAIYSYSGWMDGDYQHANIRRHLNLTNPQNKLTIGPWEHGGKYNCSPGNPGLSGFDHVGEFLKFFDYHLKGMENGLYDEPRVHYFTQQEEKWKSADTWPPEATYQNWYLGAENSFSTIQPSGVGDFDTYIVDTTAGTGDDSRWKALIGMLETPNVYPNRTEQDQKLLCYNSAPLTRELEISGHPIITLYVSSTATDGNFHVYLEDVDADGRVTYVTEGLLRALHRKLTDKPMYIDVVPARTYKKADALPLIPREVATLKFDLLPTSYLFKKGHSIRIAIAGADQNHFKVMQPGTPVIHVYRSKEFATKVALPVVER